MTFDEKEMLLFSEYIEKLDYEIILELNSEKRKYYAKLLRQSPVFIDVEIIGDYRSLKKVKYNSLKKKEI